MEYKTIYISPNELVGINIEKQLEDVNSMFDRDNLFLSVGNNGVLELNVNQVDVRSLAKQCDNEWNEPKKSLLQLIYNKIDGIKSYTITNGKRQFVDYNAERKVVNRKTKENDRSKYYYAQDNAFSKINNLLPNDFTNRIICGDSREVLHRLPDNCVDIIVTSPPYNFGLDYSNHNDSTFWMDYYNTLYGIFDECIRVLKYGGRIVINIQPLYSDYIPTHHIVSNYFLQKKMIWKSEIIWEKNNYNCKYCSWGSWKSPASPYMKYTWEYLEVFCKGDLKKLGDKDRIDISDEEFKSWVVAKWNIAPERKMKEYGHPAMFPEALVERALKLFSYTGDVVLDPFNGAGTTTYVAKKLRRRYLGIDISEEYCRTAQKRTNIHELPL